MTHEADQHPNKRRALSERTRQRLLEQGRHHLHQHGPSTPLAVRVAPVAASLGHTTGAAYQVWPNQEQFQHALATYLLTEPGPDLAGPARAAMCHVVHADGSLADAIVAISAAHLVALTGPEFVVRMHLLASAVHHDDLAALLRAAGERDHQEFADIWGQVLAHARLRITEPYTINELTTALMTTAEGFALHHLQQLPHADATYDFDTDSGRQRWSLLACTFEAIIAGFTSPVA